SLSLVRWLISCLSISADKLKAKASTLLLLFSHSSKPFLMLITCTSFSIRQPNNSITSKRLHPKHLSSLTSNISHLCSCSLSVRQAACSCSSLLHSPFLIPALYLPAGFWI